MNLVKGLRGEIQRAREELIPSYQEIGQAGAFVMSYLPELVAKAEKALDTGDAVEMIRCYKQLKEME